MGIYTQYVLSKQIVSEQLEIMESRSYKRKQKYPWHFMQQKPRLNM